MPLSRIYHEEGKCPDYVLMSMTASEQEKRTQRFVTVLC